MALLISIKLMPESFANLAGWWITAAFAVGGGTYVGADSLIKRMKPSGDQRGRSTTWMIFVAGIVDPTGDGLIIESSAVRKQTVKVTDTASPKPRAHGPGNGDRRPNYLA